MFYKDYLKADKLSFKSSALTYQRKNSCSKTIIVGKTLDLYYCRGYFTNQLLIKEKQMFCKQHHVNFTTITQKVEKSKPKGLFEVDTRQKPFEKKEKKRSSLILPKHIGNVFFVHNGKNLNSIHIYKKMLGHKFGEFVSTRKNPVHKKKKK